MELLRTINQITIFISKTAYYAQVEAMSLMKKDNETVRHFALRVQQLVKKGWCNENAATINLKNNEIFTKGLPKKLKDFAHKRQVKHVSTLLESQYHFTHLLDMSILKKLLMKKLELTT